MKKIIILTILFSYFLFAQKSFGESMSIPSIRVYPVILPISLSPGKTITQEITVENLLNKPYPLRASFADFETQSEDGGYVFKDQLTNPLLSWASLSEKDMILPARSSKKITLTIKTPKTIPLGGYYGMLFFEPVIPSNKTGTQIIARIGVLMLGELGVADDHKQKAEIVANDFGPMLQDTKELSLLLRIKNTSLHHFTAKPILAIKPVLFGESKKILIEEKIVFPGKIRRWMETIPNINPNIYKITTTIATGGGNNVNEETYLVIFPYQLTFVVLLLIMFIIFGTKKRRQIKDAMLILLTNEKAQHNRLQNKKKSLTKKK